MNYPKALTYPKAFTKLIDESEANNTFIGAGNPSGKILFIGKECAINKEKQVTLYNAEIEGHIKKWLKNIEENISQSEVKDAKCIEDYNPLYPYKGKRVIKFRKRTTGDNQGIAPTWYNYQKLYDSMLDKPTRSTQSTLVDFFEDCFMTELNHITANYSHEVDEKLRRESINSRKELFKDPFFQGFPIVIVAAGHYPQKYEVDIERLFDVKWVGYTIKKRDKFINIHKGVNSPKLLIHTNQFSYINSEQLNEIAKLCRELSKEFSIFRVVAIRAFLNGRQ